MPPNHKVVETSPTPPASPSSLSASTTSTAATAPPSRAAQVQAVALRYAMVGVLVVLTIVATSLYPGFLVPANLNNLFAQIAPVAIVAIGMTFVIIAGGFDLSVSAIFAGATVFYASFANSWPLPVAFVATLLLAIAMGVFNGLVVTLLKVNAFIATLASASLFSGLTYLYSDATPVIPTDPGFKVLGTGQWGGVWISVYVMVALALVAAFVLSRTAYGRRIFAVGGNREAARLAGMRVDLLRVSTFAITGACAAVGGMIVGSQTGIGQANIGANITLDAIAIVIIGGTSLAGGEGAIWRTVIGILIWATITNLFSSLALDTSAQLLMQGAIVLVAVAFDALSRRNAT